MSWESTSKDPVAHFALSDPSSWSLPGDAEKDHFIFIKDMKVGRNVYQRERYFACICTKSAQDFASLASVHMLQEQISIAKSSLPIQNSLY